MTLLFEKKRGPCADPTRSPCVLVGRASIADFCVSAVQGHVNKQHNNIHVHSTDSQRRFTARICHCESPGKALHWPGSTARNALE